MSDTLQEEEDQMTTTNTNTHQNPTVWHDCCKGYDHAPWCTGYVSKEVNKQEQPAARGGGEWHADTEAGFGYVWQDGGLLAKCPEPFRAQQIVTEHNQHQSLMAEQERLTRALETIRDSYWSENEPYSERVEYLQQYARDALSSDQKRTIRMKSTGATKDDDSWIDHLLNVVRHATDIDSRVAARLQIKRAMLTPDLKLRTALAEIRVVHTKKAKAVNFDDCGCDYCIALEPFEHATPGTSAGGG